MTLFVTEGQNERLTILTEECGEIIQAATKIMRFGFASTHPDRQIINRDELCTEIGDLFGVVTFMIAQGDIDGGKIEHAASVKLRKLRAGRYTNHQPANAEAA